MGKLQKDKRDIYYRKAKELGYRARSAFKLLQIDEKLNILQDVTRAVDLCAAPGGWTQVLVDRMNDDEVTRGLNSSLTPTSSSSRVIAVDLMGIAPLKGAQMIQGDITRQSTTDEIIQSLDGHKADIVVCDGAPDVIGIHDVDEFIQNELLLSALNLACNLLKPGGHFVAKIFRGKNVGIMFAHLKQFFNDVVCAKPKACRNSSIESFVTCRDFKTIQPNISAHILSSQLKPCCVPFIACGSGLDSDQSYPLNMQVIDEKDRKASSHNLISTTTSINSTNSQITPLSSLSNTQLQASGSQNKSTLKNIIKISTNTELSTYASLDPLAAPIKPPFQKALDLKRTNKLPT